MAYKVWQTGDEVQQDLNSIEDVVSRVEAPGKAADAIRYTHERLDGVDSVEEALDVLAETDGFTPTEIDNIWNNEYY